ncbi:MAG: hypothetical protein ACOY4L_00540 [Pseudomonadota bacterium]
MNTRRQVGKNSANWNPNFANWIQLANVCQLENQKNQCITDQSASWQLATPANLPTELTPCFYGYPISVIDLTSQTVDVIQSTIRVL